jgi:hypothetical protein
VEPLDIKRRMKQSRATVHTRIDAMMGLLRGGHVRSTGA